MRLRTMILIIAAIVIVAVAAGMSYAYYFAKKANAPHQAAGPTAVVSCSTLGATSGLRTFRIVPAQTTASYKVRENLIIRSLPSTVAVGKTQDVSGTFQIRTSQAPLVANLNVTVNLSTLTTDEPMRDRYIHSHALESDTYPKATFVSTCTQGIASNYSDGQQVSFNIVGNLTMHGKTNQETFAVTGKLAGDTVTGSATTFLFMSDFGIEPPNLANIAIAENKVQIILDFTAKEG